MIEVYVQYCNSSIQVYAIDAGSQKGTTGIQVQISEVLQAEQEQRAMLNV